MLSNFSLSSNPSPSGLTFQPIRSPSLRASSFHGIRIPNPNPNPNPFSGHRLRAKPSPAVMMAKKDEDLKEFRTKTTEELNEEILKLKGEIFMLRLQRSARENFKPSDFGLMRKRIARMLTVKREREMEQGIGKRLSRKLDKEWKKNIVVKPPASLKKFQEEKAAKETEKA